MFTGIIESKGKINQIVENPEGLRLSIQAESNKMNLSAGESIAVNGVCFTVISFEKNIFLVDVVKETLSKTNISTFKLNHEVNLERPLKASGRFRFGEAGTSPTSSMQVSEAYKILNLDPKKKYTKEQIQKNWKKIISRVHPDISPDCQKIASIVNEARDTILKNDFS